jgi:glucose uptake protein GlcU
MQWQQQKVLCPNNNNNNNEVVVVSTFGYLLYVLMFGLLEVWGGTAVVKAKDLLLL